MAQRESDLVVKIAERHFGKAAAAVCRNLLTTDGGTLSDVTRAVRQSEDAIRFIEARNALIVLVQHGLVLAKIRKATKCEQQSVASESFEAANGRLSGQGAEVWWYTVDRPAVRSRLRYASFLRYVERMFGASASVVLYVFMKFGKLKVKNAIRLSCEADNSDNLPVDTSADSEVKDEACDASCTSTPLAIRLAKVRKLISTLTTEGVLSRVEPLTQLQNASSSSSSSSSPSSSSFKGTNLVAGEDGFKINPSGRHHHPHHPHHHGVDDTNHVYRTSRMQDIDSSTETVVILSPSDVKQEVEKSTLPVGDLSLFAGDNHPIEVAIAPRKRHAPAGRMPKTGVSKRRTTEPKNLDVNVDIVIDDDIDNKQQSSSATTTTSTEFAAHDEKSVKDERRRKLPSLATTSSVPTFSSSNVELMDDTTVLAFSAESLSFLIAKRVIRDLLAEVCSNIHVGRLVVDALLSSARRSADGRVLCDNLSFQEIEKRVKDMAMAESAVCATSDASHSSSAAEEAFSRTAVLMALEELSRRQSAIVQNRVTAENGSVYHISWTNVRAYWITRLCLLIIKERHGAIGVRVWRHLVDLPSSHKQSLSGKLLKCKVVHPLNGSLQANDTEIAESVLASPEAARAVLYKLTKNGFVQMHTMEVAHTAAPSIRSGGLAFRSYFSASLDLTRAQATRDLLETYLRLWERQDAESEKVASIGMRAATVAASGELEQRKARQMGEDRIERQLLAMDIQFLLPLFHL